VLGGVTLERLRTAYPGASLVRAMPNTAAEVRRGVTCLCTDGTGDELAARARELFGRVGSVVELPERLMEVATAISGVAPAYVSLIAEAQIDAAVKHGMPSPVAGKLVVSSLAGSAALLTARGVDTLGVRREVASPGGLTARGLDALERGGVRSAFMDAMAAVAGTGRR
jgi:pyrroline-5-carboxylate reductase